MHTGKANRMGSTNYLWNTTVIIRWASEEKMNKSEAKKSITNNYISDSYRRMTLPSWPFPFRGKRTNIGPNTILVKVTPLIDRKIYNKNTIKFDWTPVFDTHTQKEWFSPLI